MEDNLISFIPASGRILVRPQPLPSNSSIKLDNTPDQSNIGEVIALGGVYLTHFGAELNQPCNIGDIIQFAEVTGTGVPAYQHILLDHAIYYVVLFDAVMGIYKGVQDQKNK